MSVVTQAALMCEHKPPLSPAFNQAGLRPLVEVATARWSGAAGIPSYIRPNG